MYILIRHKEQSILSYRCVEAKHAYPVSQHTTTITDRDDQLLLVHQQYVDTAFFCSLQDYRIVDGRLLYMTEFL